MIPPFTERDSLSTSPYTALGSSVRQAALFLPFDRQPMQLLQRQAFGLGSIGLKPLGAVISQTLECSHTAAPKSLTDPTPPV